MKKFAAFDIDGTLIRWQLYHAVVDRLAKKGSLGPDAHQQLHDARMKWKRREHSDAFREYEKTVINTFEAGFDKLSAQDFDVVVQEIMEEYNGQTYVYTSKLIKQLKDQGYTLLAISGSHHEIVERVAKAYGFDDWVGTDYQRVDDRFSGKNFVASHHKKQVLNELIKKHGLSLEGSLAIGDSASDAEMLEMVEQPIAFNPDQALYKIAQSNGWKLVIERKNVIYQLEKDDEQYVLA